MKILFFLFSGTGNTLRVGEELKDALHSRGHEVEIIQIRKDTEIPPLDCDMLLFGYPVHAFNAPLPFLKFLKALPKKDLPAYLIRTSGEPLKLNDASGITPRRILKQKGYTVQGEYSIVMPYNIIFRHSDGMAARMWLSAKARVLRAADEISSYCIRRQRVNVFRRAVSFVLRIEHTAMPIIGRRFRVKDACVGCGLCEKVCPQGNIVMRDGKPNFGKSCAGCMGCAFLCPKDAIKTSVLNGWRVNGEYFFTGAPAEDSEICSYCHKAYLRYFHESETNNVKINK